MVAALRPSWELSRGERTSVNGDRLDQDARDDTSNMLSAALGEVCRRDDKLHVFQFPSSGTCRLRCYSIDDSPCSRGHNTAAGPFRSALGRLDGCHPENCFRPGALLVR